MPFAAARMWIRALLQRRRVETDMEKEMRLHLDLETEANVRAGMAPDEARRQALIAFGGVDRAQEDVRDARLTRWLEHFAADLRFALRGIRKSPGFSAAVVLLLALGIGANAALFSAMYKLIISPLPYADGNRMVRLLATGNGGQFLIDMPRQLVGDWARMTQVATEIVMLGGGRVIVGDTAAEEPRRLWIERITPGALAYVGAKPVVGRDVGPADTAAGAPPVTLISHALWQSDFGGDSGVVGKTIELDGLHHAIIGVAPPGFSLPFLGRNEDLFPALRADTAGVEAIAKLRPGFDPADGNREIAALWTRYGTSSVDAHRIAAYQGMKRDVPTLQRESDMVGQAVRAMVYALVGAVALVLLIAAANVANLLMARAWNRRRELAVRSAIGAGRARLFQQLFVESFVLAVIGGALGVAVAFGSLRLIGSLQPPGLNAWLPAEAAGIQSVVLWSTAAFSLAAAILFGLGPAFLSSAADLLENLKAGGRSVTTNAFTRRLRAALVIGEVALSVVLLAGAGLLVRSLRAMHTAEIGMDAAGIHGAWIHFPERRFPRAEIRRDALRAILTAVRDIPGVDAAASATTMPPDFGIAVSGFTLGGRDVQLADSMRNLSFSRVSPDLFAVAGIRILRGRTFTESSTLNDSTGPAELIVSESFARRYWADAEAVGQRMRLGKRQWSEIVGVVNDVRIPGLSHPWERLQVYQPQSAAPARVTIVVRSTLPAPQLAERLREAIHEANPRVSVQDVDNAEEYVADWRKPHEFLLKLIGAFGAMALLLAAVGLHAVVAYAVGQRLREFGVRLALGAEPAAVMRMVHRDGIVLAAMGLGIGLLAALAATRLLRMLLYGVGPGDPMTLAGVTVVLLATAVVATHIPARRAMRVNPVAVLRDD